MVSASEASPFGVYSDLGCLFELERHVFDGGMTDTGSAHSGHAPGDHTSGSWVSVAEWVAGPNWGRSFLPRIGNEVLVEFLLGNIDQPRITGQL